MSISDDNRPVQTAVATVHVRKAWVPFLCEQVNYDEPSPAVWEDACHQWTSQDIAEAIATFEAWRDRLLELERLFDDEDDDVVIPYTASVAWLRTACMEMIDAGGRLGEDAVLLPGETRTTVRRRALEQLRAAAELLAQLEGGESR